MNRSVLYLVVTGIVLTVLLGGIALIPEWQMPTQQGILAYNDVRGMAVESQGLLYTLNFNQQNRVVAALNARASIHLESMCVTEIEKLVVYRFNAPDWVIAIK
jgi:hypothetical protein